VLVLAVLLVVAHFDCRRLLGVGGQRFERAFERMLEVAPDVSGPADVERAPTPVEHDAGLVLMALRASAEAIHVDVVEPVSEREFDVVWLTPLFNNTGAVNVNFQYALLAPETPMLVRESRDFNPFPVIVWNGGMGNTASAMSKDPK